MEVHDKVLGVHDKVLRVYATIVGLDNTEVGVHICTNIVEGVQKIYDSSRWGMIQ